LLQKFVTDNAQDLDHGWKYINYNSSVPVQLHHVSNNTHTSTQIPMPASPKTNKFTEIYISITVQLEILGQTERPAGEV
jgi:hypothetical protein